MSVSSVGLDPTVGSTSFRSSVRQARQDFDQLFQSLKSGDLNAAQQAYSAFQQVQAGLTSATSTQTSTATATPVTADWSALGQALQSGSLSSAQDALGKLQQDAQTAWQQEVQNAQSVYALMQGQQAATSGTTSTGTSTSATSTANSVQNDLSSLNQSLQSGDTASAQKLLTQLEQDLQASGQGFGSHHHHQGGLSGLNGTSSYTTTSSTVTPTTLSSATPPVATVATTSSNSGKTS